MVNELGESAVTLYRQTLVSQGVQTCDLGLVPALKTDTYDAVIFIIYVQASQKNIQAVRYWAPTAKLIIDSVDVQFGRYMSRARLTNQQSDIEFANKVKEEEIATYHQADFIIVVSEQERQLLVPDLPDSKLAIIPNIHPMGEYIPTAARDKNVLMFVGWGQYEPNSDAVLYFANEILPLILEKAPQVRFKVIGEGYPEAVKNLHGGPIEILGHVPSMHPYLTESYISVAPLRYGSGVKGKIGEALSYGLPVVTTSIGLEGFGLTPGKQILIGDTPREFADHVLGLLNDPVRHAEIGISGRNFLEQNFSEAVVKIKINEVFQHIEQTPVPWLKLKGRVLCSRFYHALNRYVLWRFNKSH
ncbi:glycosyltransferase family 4 protein [Methylomonas koyamae]|uniref:glycosyltransferase family 4 protein n=1 Tax=Methylomonas koyamae TaxID=702114 RepID=UPI00155DB13A|nr:glycosyltransferase [Methylomonas koyamae]